MAGGSAGVIGTLVDPGTDEARDWLRRELATGGYTVERPLLERFRDWIFGLFSRLGGDGSAPSWLVPLVVLLVLGVAALVLWRVLRRNVRAPASPTAPGVLEDVDATADELRALAQQALDRGEAGEALIAAYRAVVASAIERTWLADRPGRTAHEAARELSTLVPTERQAVADAAAAFDAVRFGRAAASADQVRGVMELDSRLRSARPDQLALAAPW